MSVKGTHSVAVYLFSMYVDQMLLRDAATEPCMNLFLIFMRFFFKSFYKKKTDQLKGKEYE